MSPVVVQIAARSVKCSTSALTTSLIQSTHQKARPASTALQLRRSISTAYTYITRASKRDHVPVELVGVAQRAQRFLREVGYGGCERREHEGSRGERAGASRWSASSSRGRRGACVRERSSCCRPARCFRASSARPSPAGLSPCARTFVPQPEASSSITPRATSESHSRRCGGSFALHAHLPEPAAQCLLRTHFVPELGRGLDQRAFYLDGRHGPLFGVWAGNPARQAGAGARSPASHSCGKIGSIRPAGSGSTRSARAAGGPSFDRRPEVVERHQQADRGRDLVVGGVQLRPVQRAFGDQAIDVIEHRRQSGDLASDVVVVAGVVELRAATDHRSGRLYRQLRRHPEACCGWRVLEKAHHPRTVALERPPDDRARECPGVCRRPSASASSTRRRFSGSAGKRGGSG